MKHNRNIAIIPARSGSKGVEDKNIREMLSKPLMAYSIEAALETELFCTVMVSTDSNKYALIARDYGAEVPFLRSDVNSSDVAGSWDVIEEVLYGYEKMGQRFDSICLLQPTSPLRTSNDIIKAYELLDMKNADAITSVCECEYPIEYITELPEDHSLEYYRERITLAPRQLLQTHYRINGAIYIRMLKYEKDTIIIKSKQEYAYIMCSKNSVDIDTLEDFEYAEYLMNNKHK